MKCAKEIYFQNQSLTAYAEPHARLLGDEHLTLKVWIIQIFCCGAPPLIP